MDRKQELYFDRYDGIVIHTILTVIILNLAINFCFDIVRQFQLPFITIYFLLQSHRERPPVNGSEILSIFGSDRLVFNHLEPDHFLLFR